MVSERASCTSGVETGVFTGDDKLKHKGTRETGLS